MMTEARQGQDASPKPRRSSTAFHELVTDAAGSPPAALEGLGKLEVFAGVREYPARVKCARLAWHTLKNAVEAVPVTARTEEE